jgi:hypothetical protein
MGTNYIPGEPIIEVAPYNNFNAIVLGMFCNDNRLTQKEDDEFHCIFIKTIKNTNKDTNMIIKTANGFELTEQQKKKVLKTVVADKRKGLGKILSEYDYTTADMYIHFSLKIFAFVNTTSEQNGQELLAYNYFNDLGENLLNSRIGGKNTSAYNKKISKTSSKKVAIKNITTGEVFESIKEAEQQYQTNHIADVLAGKRTYAANCQWEYVDMQNKTCTSTKKIDIEQRQTDTNKAIRCIETDKVFQNIREANEFLGCKKSHISTVLLGDVPTSNGYHWEYADEQGLSKSREHYNMCKIGYKEGTSPVLNIDENIAYPSVSFAAEQNFLNKTKISQNCLGRQQCTINKYNIVSHWKYISKDEYIEYVKNGKADYQSLIKNK